MEPLRTRRGKQEGRKPVTQIGVRFAWVSSGVSGEAMVAGHSMHRFRGSRFRFKPRSPCACACVPACLRACAKHCKTGKQREQRVRLRRLRWSILIWKCGFWMSGRLPDRSAGAELWLSWGCGRRISFGGTAYQPAYRLDFAGSIVAAW